MHPALSSSSSSSSSLPMISPHPPPLHMPSSSSASIRSVRTRLTQVKWVLPTARCYAAAASPPSSSSSSLSLYAVLGVDCDVSLSVIKSAYRQMARRYHPDVCRGSDVDACTHKFLAVQEAYEILSDPERRADYDFTLLHPFCAQALGKGGFPSNFRMSQRRGKATEARGEASAGWKLQWEAQINMLKQRRRRPGPFAAGDTKSWGAKARCRNVQNSEASSRS